MSDTKELREAIQTFGSQAINEGDLNELLDRIEAAESVLKDFGTTAQEVECWLERYRRLEREAEAMRAKIAEMEQQAPVAWLHESRRDSDVVTSSVKHVWGKAAVGSMAAYSIPLYRAPGAKGE